MIIIEEDEFEKKMFILWEMTVKMETKKKMEIKNGDRGKGTLKPIKYVHWSKEKVNNEAWFKAKIEGLGRHS